MSASKLRDQALMALDQYEAAVNKKDKAAAAPDTWRGVDAQPEPSAPMSPDAVATALERLTASIERLAGFVAPHQQEVAPRQHETEPTVKRVPARGQWIGMSSATEPISNGSGAIAGD